ncbi:PREDICTED: uncharacterized protein LOC106329670 [Brassica oleracea var. oleracea]|uniref:uncharacterized protein LOC106329670 n=1 Tax=Brassica oleracea var. oleracea TaxID=109376 RepID=UPI0006A6D45D|nr:PREDICTED: uncharacterized protein LOC106329670 [Brassica oleracea var. oleracea]
MINVVQKDLLLAYKEEESHWRQKRRDKWLVFGDKSSKFFHGSVKTRRSKNYISKLKDKHNQEQRSEGAKAEVAIEYFSELFKTSNPRSYDPAFESFPPKVTTSMNRLLTKSVSKEEVKEAIFSIKGDSAPGPDGMTGTFFQKYWDIIGTQITREIQEVFESGIMPKDWNFTYLCLLPKISNPENMSDIRPISLCSVLYKTVSKILVKRVQPFLKSLVSINQSAFVSERNIFDNIIIAHEAVHALKVHPTISNDSMAVKTDMSKAFDRVEWNYLQSLMKALGFDQKWIKMIMMCITSVTFAVLVNDHPFGLIKPQRGLRQGDPLSLFLFVLCTEGLTHLLNVVERNDLFKGLQFSRQGPAIHHLLFADDSLFLCKASQEQALALQRILKFYGDATGQNINVQKSSISFGDNVPETEKLAIQNTLGITKQGGASKYLGLPECFSGSKVDLLTYIKEQTQGKLEGWYLQHLSQGGKEVLLKSSAGGIPFFPMSCFRLPKTIIMKLNSMMANFWWGADSHKSKVHWVSWEKMCLPKQLGGMGFKDLECFNQALLAKQAWKILHKPQCLLARVLKSRYFTDGEFLSAALGERPSYVWRSLLFGRDLLQKGLQHRVGNGENTRVWLHKWVADPVEGMRAPWIKNLSFDVNLMASSLIDPVTKRWNVLHLSEIFVPGDVQLLLQNQPVADRADFFSWKFNKSGLCTVKSAYWLASKEKTEIILPEINMMPSLNVLKERTWKLQTVPKIKVFIWKSISDALPTADLITKRGMKIDKRCQTCGAEVESINHLLFYCSFARLVWANSNIPHPRGGYDPDSVYANFNSLLALNDNRRVDAVRKRKWPWILWHLWKRRNEVNFQGRCFSATDLVQKATQDADEWFAAQTVEEEWQRKENPIKTTTKKNWTPPEQGWNKCNIGVEYDRSNGLVGGGWVLRNERGVVLCHSRRAFSGCRNKEEAKLTVVLWAMESMSSQRQTRVTFAGDFSELFRAAMRPEAWPSFLFQSGCIGRELEGIEEWKLEVVTREANRGAYFIAQSVTKLGLVNSYVARGHPDWLFELFVNESRNL